ncbi:hypothetical protein DVB69_15685 [Sporosarcina sp. BI001-red]|uniref:DUF4097 family beta strand repeat-containing protein n=1 Tax=Sporosarcina sp. BI001-red TaxID=2282866 RepID=UPI000E22B049|nr:DUF4097 family beta strand repeat-containing protein [Sporosarcina sp. BI001-red]REB05201.1 hypothetical protein DVB69_15685 [Sporosarcina sp. BI001-red]
MIFKNKLFVALVVVLIVAGGISFLFKPGSVFEKSTNKKVIEDLSFTTITVFADNAAVEIVPTQDSVTTVEYSGKTKKNKKFIFEAAVKGDTLDVQFKEKRKSFIQFGFSSLDLTLTVHLPEKQYERLKVETDNGRIIAEQLQAKDINLETDNGKIELKDVDAEEMSVKSDNGRITLENVTGQMKAKTYNGRIYVVTNNLDQSMDLETDNGRIEIQTETEPTNATIDAKTDNGRVELFGQENKHLTFGAGKNLVKLGTDNGRITVTK